MTDSWIQGFSVKGFYGQIYHHDYKTIVKISKIGDSHFRFCILELSGDIDWVAIESHNYIILQLNCTDIRVVLQFPNQVLTTWTFLIRKKKPKRLLSSIRQSFHKTHHEINDPITANI